MEDYKFTKEQIIGAFLASYPKKLSRGAVAKDFSSGTFEEFNITDAEIGSHLDLFTSMLERSVFDTIRI